MENDKLNEYNAPNNDTEKIDLFEVMRKAKEKYPERLKNMVIQNHNVDLSIVENTLNQFREIDKKIKKTMSCKKSCQK